MRPDVFYRQDCQDFNDDSTNLIVELKAIDALAPIHHAQILSYLRMTGLELGLLVNFNVPVLKYGIKRVVYTKK